jgi:hypothetical protein
MESSSHVRKCIIVELHVLTMERKVVEFWHIPRGAVGVTRVWQTSAWVPQLIEEGVNHGVDGRQPLSRGVFQQLGDQIDRIRIGLPEHLCMRKLRPKCVPVFFTYLTERMRLDLGKLVLHVVGVHGTNLVSGRRAEDFDDLHELVNTGLSREQGLTKHELCHHTAS